MLFHFHIFITLHYSLNIYHISSFSFYSPFPLHFFTADCQRTVGKVSSAIGVKAATLAILYETDHRPNNPFTLSLVSSFCPGTRWWLGDKVVSWSYRILWSFKRSPDVLVYVHQKSFYFPNKDLVCVAKLQPQDVGQCHEVFFYSSVVFYCKLVSSNLVICRKRKEVQKRHVLLLTATTLWHFL